LVLINIFLDIVVLLTDTHTYCLLKHVIEGKIVQERGDRERERESKEEAI